MVRNKAATVSTAGHGSRSKRKQLHMEKMRLAKKKRAENSYEIGDVGEARVECRDGPAINSFDLLAENNAQPEGESSSAKKIRGFQEYVGDGLDQEIFGDHTWCLMEMGQLNRLLSDLTCPMCDNGSVSISLGEKSGLARKMKLQCSTCIYSAQDYTSPKIFDADRKDMPFDVNQRAVLYSVQTGGGFAALNKLCTIFGIPNMCENSYQRIHKTVCTASVQTCDITLTNCREIVKSVYEEIHTPDSSPSPDSWDVDDGIPWIDVSFDGTWQRRGHVSHYGVGLVVDILTGYVLDCVVRSTYCHACKIKEGQGLSEEEWDAWMQDHHDKCQQNHHGSAKAMERDAALELWNNSVERTGFRYRTMLSDGDSAAFSAVEAAMPYGEDRPVIKLECVNHVHKRMGAALRKLTKEDRLGGRGQGRLTLEKCDRLQNYYRGAVLHNLDKTEEDIRNAIWGTFFLCISTDEEPCHSRCPPGASSWCFYRKAQAQGQEPGSHASHMRTALSLEVAEKLIPLYRRMSSSQLLQKILHGKTQNANESFHSVLWSLLPKTKFFGKQRVEAAVASAIGKFNRGNYHLTEIMNMLSMDVNNVSVSIVEHQDAARIKKANSAAEAVYAVRRNRRRLMHSTEQARQTVTEGPVYGVGLLGDGFD